MANAAPIDLGPTCNNRCVFCAQGDLRLTAAALEDEAVRAQLERAATEGAPGVTFVGGEPTMHEGLEAWIRAAAALPFDAVCVQTNGRRLAVRGYAGALVDAGLTHLEVSLHGPDSAIHDYHTRTPRSFRQTARGLLFARDLDVRVGVTTVVTRSNFRHLEAVAAVVARVGASAWHVTAAEPIGSGAAHRARVVPNPEMALPWIRRAVDQCRESGVEPTISGFGELDPHVRRLEDQSGFPFAGLGGTE